MNLIIIITMALICVGCARGAGEENEDVSQKASESVNMSAAVCSTIKYSIGIDYLIYTPIDKYYYVLTNNELYRLNFATNVSTKIYDDIIDMDRVCKFTVAAGVVVNIEVMAAPISTCGGFFQPACLPPPPPSYPPQW